MRETIYTAESELRFPRLFFGEMLIDLKTSKKVAKRLFFKNLKAGYKQNLLGYLWIILPPLITAAIWILLSTSKVFNFNNSSDRTYIPYVLTGVFWWQTFTETIYSPFQQINNHRNIISKFKIPHEALIFSGLGEIVFNLIIRNAILLITLLVFRTELYWTVILVPLGLISIIVLGLAIGLLITPFSLLFKDIPNSIGLILQILFFLTPIIYPAPTEGLVHLIVKYNPISIVLVTTRDWFLTGNLAPQRFFTLVLFLSIFSLLFSWITYRLSRPHFIERI